MISSLTSVNFRMTIHCFRSNVLSQYLQSYLPSFRDFPLAGVGAVVKETLYLLTAVDVRRRLRIG